MVDQQRTTEERPVPFRGTGKATDFHDVQDYREGEGVGDRVAEFSKENPLTAVVSMFGFGLVLGAGVAVAMSAAKEKQAAQLHYFKDFRNAFGDSLSSLVPEKVSDAFHRG